MSKIALKGIVDGSATITVQPPNSVTNRTLTLPDSDGVLLNDTALALSSGAEKIGFLQSGTGAAARTVQDKLRDVVSVKDFGAVGDGVTDDTAAIQAALDHSIATGKKLIFTNGDYLFTSLAVITPDVGSNSLVIESNGPVRLISTKTTPDQTSSDSDYAIKFYGRYLGVTTLTQDANISSGLLRLSDVQHILPGDMISLQSTRLIQTDNRGEAREGQVVIVKSVNYDEKTVGLETPVEFFAPKGTVTEGSISSVTSTTIFVLSGINLQPREANVLFTFTSGALAGQSRYITSWDNTTKTAIFGGWQSAWPSGAQSGDSFTLTWAVSAAFIRPIRVEMRGDISITREEHLNATAGDYGFRGLDIVFADRPVISGVRVSNFSETCIRFRSCVRPTLSDSSVDNANRSYNEWDGTGYGVSINQCLEAVVSNVRVSRCRKGIDVIGAQAISWRTSILNCSVSGGGVGYAGDAFWPVGTALNSGIGSHGGAYGTVYTGCIVSDVEIGYPIRGLEETIQSCAHRGYGDHCVRITYGGGLVINGFVYNDRFSEIGMQSDTRYHIASLDNKRCRNFLKVETDVGAYLKTYPIIVQNVVARSLQRSFIFFYGASTSATIENVMIGNNVAYCSSAVVPAPLFSFIASEGAKVIKDISDLGGNRYMIEDGAFTTFSIFDLGTALIQNTGEYWRVSDDMWACVLDDDTAIKIPIGKGAKVALVSVFDRERDRGYRAADMLIYLQRAIDYSPLQATNKLLVNISDQTLTGTTGTDGRLTIALVPGGASVDPYLHVENRLGYQARPIFIIKVIG
jgi:hypothetical protein